MLPVSEKPSRVLFLCTGNSARSIMAEVMLNHLGHGRFKAYSAGSHPKGTVHPLALETMQGMGLPMDGLWSKSWEEFGDFCISPEKVHSTVPRAFVIVRIDHQNFEFIAYRETALFRR